MIKMSKSGEAYFWIGGPGEEAFNACLGSSSSEEGAAGPAFDYLLICTTAIAATLVAMGMTLADGIRQMAMTATDTHSMGRIFFRPLCQCRLERHPDSRLRDRGAICHGAQERL